MMCVKKNKQSVKWKSEECGSARPGIKKIKATTTTNKIWKLPCVETKAELPI